MSTQADTSPRFSVTRTTPALWRVTFDNPPINLVDPLMVVELHQLLTEIEQDHHVAVIVFESANCGSPEIVEGFLSRFRLLLGLPDLVVDGGEPVGGAVSSLVVV
ncbi:hypothetical protein KL864_32525, partial [Mycolicibacterium goodii]|nr:hypothetical protein [Mycolicibacterium goodii]